jgi:hypothetical protein
LGLGGILGHKANYCHDGEYPVRSGALSILIHPLSFRERNSVLKNSLVPVSERRLGTQSPRFAVFWSGLGVLDLVREHSSLWQRLFQQPGNTLAARIPKKIGAGVRNHPRRRRLMSKLAVPAAFIFSRDALDTYARLTVSPAEAAPRVRAISLATLSALPHQASHHVEHQRPPRACILRPSPRLSRACPRQPRAPNGLLYAFSRLPLR